MTEIKDEECSACHKKHIDTRTEIITPPLDSKPGHIRKAIFFRCEDHINCDADEMEYLSLLKSMNVKHEELHFDTCASPHDTIGSAVKGVSVTHKPTGTTASYNNEKYQSFNKIRAIQKLKSELNSLSFN
ncbi:hypothetical protein CWB58_09865 [Pseudoalteromonas sp. S201]|uniref:peptide chain release factor family protein n=1 Tax=Pseudoalteromonas sp. S201 TaxID=579519 RepID=UPI00110CDDD3|nr:peptide chain release factor-like protein [Pseudoalteromonas sp. S201]TMS93323.1 hypothetical protein CWB58_09865 [Pseudoalteromonas sp. S201]